MLHTAGCRGWHYAPALKGMRSLENMCCSCCCQPLSDAKAIIMDVQPRVKLRANLEGDRMMVGKAMVKARMRKKRPAPMKQKKYIICCPVGMLQRRTEASGAR
jgi:hypothetical protein